ncbi:FxLYD domain-containing protein [Halorussus halobius]|uniref:FxLYD domain-containing protein n=1 Tax=Halorussus halobius TaxID=1710537 RepID=UPI001091CC31|nr:FxLYD domain-containing protein [Halorussus halobius]
MNRRQLLAAASAAATASLAGCTGTLAPEPSVEWDGDYYAGDGALDTDAALYYLGELSNTGGNHIKTIELTITLLDENDQEITSRTKELTGIRAGTTQEFHFRVGLSDGEVGDLDDVEISADVLATNYAPLANPSEDDSESTD